jgi:hypothetical protein
MTQSALSRTLCGMLSGAEQHITVKNANRTCGRAELLFDRTCVGGNQPRHGDRNVEDASYRF